MQNIDKCPNDIYQNSLKKMAKILIIPILCNNKIDFTLAMASYSDKYHCLSYFNFIISIRSFKMF